METLRCAAPTKKYDKTYASIDTNAIPSPSTKGVYPVALGIPKLLNLGILTYQKVWAWDLALKPGELKTKVDVSKSRELNQQTNQG